MIGKGMGRTWTWTPATDFQFLCNLANFSLFLLFPILKTDLLILWTKIIRFLTYIMAKRTKSFLQNGFIWQTQKQDNVHHTLHVTEHNKLQAVWDRAFKWTGNFYRKQYKNTFTKKYPSLLNNPKTKLIINGDITKVLSFQPAEGLDKVVQ